MMRGGARVGAGRKPLPEQLRKNPVLVKLPQWIIDWMSTQDKNRAELIEEALCKLNQLSPPKD